MLKAMLIVIALGYNGNYTVEMPSMSECLDVRKTIAMQDASIKTLCVPSAEDQTKVRFQEFFDEFIKMIDKIHEQTENCAICEGGSAAD